MLRNRIIYQVQTVHVADNPTGAHFEINGSGLKDDLYATFESEHSDLASGIDEATFVDALENLVSQLHRVQSVNHSFSIEKTNVNQFGELAAIDRVVLNTPTVNVDLDYYLANFENEKNVGFNVSGSTSAVSGLLNKTSDEKNYYIKIADEGIDAIGDTTQEGSTIGFGNAFLTSYSSTASVGNFPTVSLSFEALNVLFENTISGALPGVNPRNGVRATDYKFKLPTSVSSPGTGDLDISTLRPGDITLTLLQREASDEGSLGPAQDTYSTLGTDISDAKIQSYTLSFDLSREMIQELGSDFAISREISFPVDINLSIDSILSSLTTGSLSDLISCGNSYDIFINLNVPKCNPLDENKLQCQYVLRNAELVGQSFSADIGSNKTATLNFLAQLGGVNQTGIGLFMSGTTT